MAVELQQKSLDTFSNLTQKTTELNKNILDNSNIIIEAINNMNRNTNSNMSQIVVFSYEYFENISFVAISS